MQLAPPEVRYDAELLIVEARRRARRRRVAIATIVVVAAGAGLAGYAMSRPSPTPPAASHPVGTATQAPSPTRPAPATRTLSRPATLAIGRHGLLYIADDSRNMIFARHADGRITVVAGTGRRGFSGDGGPASRAMLDHPAGMAYDRGTHTLFVADAGNNRVRAINAQGVIRTVAGSGRSGWVRSKTPARQANLDDPLAVALSPGGRLLITTDLEVLRLDPSGRLTRIAGIQTSAGISRMDGPASRASTDSADGLAFDRHGDLYLTGFATKGLLAITPNGRMHDLTSYTMYPRGDAGIVTAPDGSVIIMNTQQIDRYTSPEHWQVLVNFARTGPIDGVRAIVPTGLAISRHGTIYIDTSDRDGWTNKTSIMAISPNMHQVRVIWRARRTNQ
jgi:DNA-binding beta-propeller fold protein YncE